MGRTIPSLTAYGSVDTELNKKDLYEIAKNSGTYAEPIYATDGSRKITLEELAQQIAYILDPQNGISLDENGKVVLGGILNRLTEIDADGNTLIFKNLDGIQFLKGADNISISRIQILPNGNVAFMANGYEMFFDGYLQDGQLIVPQLRLYDLDSETVTVPNDNTIDQVLVLDTDGVVKYRDASTISGGGGILHGTASGIDNYSVTISGVASYADGDAYLVRFTDGNTSGCSLNINSLGAKTLYRNNDGELIAGDIENGAEMLCIYNSSLDGFQVIGTSPNSLIAYVTNDDSVTITKGMVVYAFGGTGDRMTVKRAQNTGDSTSAQTVGLVLSSSIAAGQKGFIMMQGLLDGLSILPTSTYSDGDPIYLGSTAGSITNVKPYAPNHLVYLGVVTTASNGSAGRMYVKVQNGYELDELHNVQAQSPTLKDTLWYDNTVSPGQWKTASIPTILGFTPLEGNAAITGATKTKITYDSKGLVTAGADLEASDLPSGIDASKIADGSVSNTEFQYLGGVTSDIQTQINNINSGISTKKFINNTPTAAHTGTTTNTIVQSVLIPANTYTVGDIIKITMRGNKTTTNAVMTTRFYINTSNSLSGATLLATLPQSGAFGAAIGISRNLSITSETTTETINPSTLTNTQDEGLRDNISLNTNINIDWTSDQYIIFAFQLGNISDSATVNHYIIEKR